MTVAIIETRYDGDGIPYADRLPEWELIRFHGQLVPLTKNNAMRVMLDRAKPENRGQSPEFVASFAR